MCESHMSVKLREYLIRERNEVELRMKKCKVKGKYYDRRYWLGKKVLIDSILRSFS